MPEECRAIQQIAAGKTADRIETGFAEFARQKQDEARVTVTVKLLPVMRGFGNDAQVTHSLWTARLCAASTLWRNPIASNVLLMARDLLREAGAPTPNPPIPSRQATLRWPVIGWPPSLDA